MLLASLINAASNVGYPLLVVLVMAESGGIPLPGETSLITAAILASDHRLNIVAVIAIAAASAIVGDNIGYLIGRKGGRWLLERPGMFERQRHEALRIGESFFERHGPKAVFLGRWVLGLRTWASWLAGATRMEWKEFALWNAAGGISWATTIGLLAYFAGSQVKSAISTFGLWALVVVAVLVVALFVAHRLLHRRHRARAVAAANDASRPAAAGAQGGSHDGLAGPPATNGRPGAVG